MKFSVVVATYNRKEVLERCIDSIIGQTYQDFELFVVDDGSTDSTEEMVRGIHDTRIRYHRFNHNTGAATAARNYGIEHMTGDALVIWDSDDVLYPHAFFQIAEVFQSVDVSVVCSSTDFFKGPVRKELLRRQSGFLTYLDWIAGKRPQDAEIIAIRKQLIGDLRFQSRGIDFMFYSELMIKNKPTIYYIENAGGAVYLESDDISLTKKRKTRNNKLSAERAPILSQFIRTYESDYKEANATPRLAGYAFGAGIGFVILEDYKSAREMLQCAVRYEPRWMWRFILGVVNIPGIRAVFRRMLVSQNLI